MPINDSQLQIQAQRILDAIAFTPFEQCYPVSREFANIPARPGIYAVRHKTDGLLYIGKTKSLRGRFSGDTKLFCGHGLINIVMKIFVLQYSQFLTGKTLSYYWS
ncbi:GIY-YIG nuclease family protein [Calothrix sp. CCY 0018]|uniref:GIY-YIG nuclease family protein n=1 Tax=Calothrix sp. CCY 0018 TaxID=3103864 RepID=UPI0039C689F8